MAKPKPKPTPTDDAPTKKGALTVRQQTALEGGHGVQQGRFAFRVVARRYSVLEGTTRPEMLSVFAAALLALGGAVRIAYGDTYGALAFFGGAGVHAVLAMRAWLARRRRAAPGSTHAESAFVTPSGSLAPTLERGETVLCVSTPSGKDNLIGRTLGGVFQSAWGVLVGGLPLVLYTFLPQSVFSAALVGALAAVGAGLFGRGLRALFFTREAKRIVFTDRRAIALFAPGQARVLPYEHLRFMPLVVGRDAGDATLALDVVPQTSTTPLPLMGLWGADSVPHDEAAKVARAATEKRRSDK